MTSNAQAANRPDFRDCAFAGGFDPDFVQLGGGMTGQGNVLTVSSSQKSVQVTASESADPGDNMGSDTLKLTITSPGMASQTVSGSGIGKVVLAAPLPSPGHTYTIDWVATFDNGNHQCPSSSTPQNTSPQPFVVMVPSASSPAPKPKPKPKRRCHKVTKRVHGHKKTVLVCHKRKK